MESNKKTGYCDTNISTTQLTQDDLEKIGLWFLEASRKIKSLNLS